MAPANVGRAAWIAYLTFAIPVAFLSIAMVFGGIDLLFVEPVGVIEGTHTPQWMKVLALGSFAMFPTAWGIGLLLGHRFNGPRQRMIPFLINLVPTIGLLALGVAMMLNGDGGLEWVIVYVAALTAFLLLGTMAAIADRVQQ